MTPDNKTPAASELPWRKGKNLFTFFNTQVAWNQRRDEEVGFIGSPNTFATRLGLGTWVTSLDMQHWLQSEERVAPGSLVKNTYGIFANIVIGHGLGISRYGIDPEIIVRNDGLWIPNKAYKSDGQDFRVLTQDTGGIDQEEYEPYLYPSDDYTAVAGESIAARAVGENRHLYPLVQGTFTPNYRSAHHTISSSFIYLWDRPEGTLKLRRVLTRSAEEKHNDYTTWREVDGTDTDVSVSSFGVFRLPGRIKETDWLKNIFFPRRRLWYQKPGEDLEPISKPPTYLLN